MKIDLFLALAFVLPLLALAQQPPVPVEEEPHHHLLLKNDFVMVVRVKLLPGESTLFHTHSHDRVAIDLTNTTVTFQKPGEAEHCPSQRSPEALRPRSRKALILTACTIPAPPTLKCWMWNCFSGRRTLLLQPEARQNAENPSARVYKWTIAPGASSAMHTHERPYLIISATPLMLKMTDPEGKSFTHEVKAGNIHWVDAKVTHSLANEGTTEGQIVEIELK